MSTELGPPRPYQLPAFTAEDETQIDRELQQRVRRPMRHGLWVIGVFVVLMTVVAGFTPLTAAVSAPGMVRVEDNRKTLRHLAGGVVREIMVREGQQVKAGQPLLRMDEVQAKAAYDVLQSQHDALLAQAARLQAEATGQRELAFPAELTARSNDPRVAGLMRDQTFLFTSKLALYESQASMLDQRVDQFRSQATGIQAQIDSVAEQVRLTNEELAGYRTLNEKGYAPKTLILRYERNLADLAGRRGGLVGELGRNREQTAEAQIQLAALREQRITQAAEQLRETQTRLSDVGPRLAAARQAYQQTTIRAPADGYVLNLQTHTVGGVVGSGEHLMDVVPVNSALIIAVHIDPKDVDNVRPGMEARVTLTGLAANRVKPMLAKVATVSADALADEKTGQSYFTAELRVPPKELKKLPAGARLAPGMPAQAMITGSQRTILAYVLGPITDTLRLALREE